MGEALALLERRQRSLPYELVRGCFQGSIEDGYQGPPLDEVFAMLAHQPDWQNAIMRLVALSAVAVHRIAQVEERLPLEVLDDMIPKGAACR